MSERTTFFPDIHNCLYLSRFILLDFVPSPLWCIIFLLVPSQIRYNGVMARERIMYLIIVVGGLCASCLLSPSHLKLTLYIRSRNMRKTLASCALKNIIKDTQESYD